MASLTEITGKLGAARARHLLRRCTFGPTPARINEFADYTIAEALDVLFEVPAEPDAWKPAPPIDPKTDATWVDPEGQAFAGELNSGQDELFRFFQSWHLDVMLRSGINLRERITWWLHTHLPARWTEINSSEAMYYQNCLYRHYAFGSFKELFTRICTDNAWLVYLDGYTNHKDNPNENFAREMFELYSIGKGPQLEEGNYTNYTEDDIKAATRVLTGWSFDDTFSYIDGDTGLPMGKMKSVTSGDPAVAYATGHDAGKKTFSSVWSNLEIEPAVVDPGSGLASVEAAYGELDAMMDMIFGNPETARFIVRKLYRFFVYHFISDEVEQDIIVPLAETFATNDFSIPAVLGRLFRSEPFYDEDTVTTTDNNIGALIKSPVDLFMTLFRFFEVSLPDRGTETAQHYADMGYVVSKLEDQGLNFYEPFEVAGYPAYHQIPGYNRNWITTYALAHRYQTGDVIMKRLGGSEEYSFQLDIVDWVDNSGVIADPSVASQVVDVLIDNLLAVTPNQDRYDYFLHTVFLDTLDANNWSFEWTAYKAGGDDLVVRERLETLLTSLIQTPEFQLY